MSNNFEWQKQQANERIQGALQDAASHRLSREGSHGGSFVATSFKAVFLLGIVWLLIGFFLSGCAPSQQANLANPESKTIVESSAPLTITQTEPLWTMADRIRFQDRLWEQSLAKGEFKPQQAESPWTMADRIRFQDRLWEQYLNTLDARAMQVP